MHLKVSNFTPRSQFLMAVGFNWQTHFRIFVESQDYYYSIKTKSVLLHKIKTYNINQRLDLWWKGEAKPHSLWFFTEDSSSPAYQWNHEQSKKLSKDRKYLNFRHSEFFSSSICDLCDKREPCQPKVHKSLLPNTINQQSCRNLHLRESLARHNRKFRSKFFFSNCTGQPSQNHTTCRHS